MKAVLVLLLALLAFSSANLIDGRYRFSSEVASSSSRASNIALTSAVIISAVASDDEAQWYNLFLEDLTINGELAPAAFLPFQFSRYPDGQIGSIRVHPEETLELKNLKKGIAESFQTKISQSPRPQEVTEIGADGMRNVRYEVVYADSDKLDVRGAYTYGDFVSFPKDSRMEEMPFEIIANKVTTMKPKGKLFQSAVAKTQIISFQGDHHLEILATTRMEFETSEIAMIDMLFEADWVVETLIHDVDVAARVENLKASLPAVETLFTAILNNKLAGKELLVARGQLATLMNNDEESLNAGLEIILANLQEATKEQYAFLASTLSRVNAREAQRILAAEIEAAAQSGNDLKLVALLKSLATLSQPENPAAIFSAVMKVNSHRQVNALVELTIGHLLKLLPTEAAEEAIAHFTVLLSKATTDADKVHYLHVLGNAGQHAPINFILSFLADPSLEVRAAVLTDVRYHLHLVTVQQTVVAAMAQEANRKSRSVMSSLVGSLKQNMKTNDIGENFKDFLAALAEIDPTTEAAATLREFLAEKNISRKNSEVGILVESDIWNDTHPGYELVAPLSQRQQDVARYPSYTAFLFSNQYGPNFANLKIAGGVFSGTGGDACLAGDFKIFDKLYTEIRAFKELTTLADLQLYVLTYENEFESRIYAIVNGNTLIDINLSSNCTEEEHIIFSGTIDIIVWDTEIPISIGNVFIYAYVYAGLELDGGYEICLLTLNPFVELWVTGEINMTVDSGVTITAVGIIRAGLEGDVYINYAIGPDTQLGSIVNNTSGEHVCKACIGVYYGYEEQNAYVGLFIQRREGLGWGDKTVIPLSEWVEPAVPFPTPLVEVCSDDAVEYTFRVLEDN